MSPLVVDGMNVIGSRPDGWWRDRAGAMRRLVEVLSRRAAETGDEITVVFDGRALPDLPEGRHGPITIRYSRRRGKNAADDRIVEMVEADPAVTVVTADRDLRARVARLGASVSGPRTLLESNQT
jgi:predicted RNA-binding protein with PIN domain